MGTNRQFDKNSSSKTYTHNNKNLKMKFSALIAVAFANDNVADDEWVGPLANSTGIARSGGSRGASDSGERRYDDLGPLPASTGASRDCPAATSSTSASTGPTAATVSCSVTDQ